MIVLYTQAVDVLNACDKIRTVAKMRRQVTRIFWYCFVCFDFIKRLLKNVTTVLYYLLEIETNWWEPVLSLDCQFFVIVFGQHFQFNHLETFRGIKFS